MHRRILGLSQKELGYLLGYDGHTTVSRIEQGKHQLNAEDIVTLEQLTQKSFSRIFPDLYAKVTGNLIHRLKMFDQHLSEMPETNEYMQKRQKLLTIYRIIEGEITETI